MGPHRLRLGLMRRGLVGSLALAIASLSASPANADSSAVHAPVWCNASVDLTVIGGAYSNSTGVSIPQCVSPLTTIAGAGGSTATGAASTSGIWGTSVTALAAAGGTAPPFDLFVSPIVLVAGPGMATLDTDATRSGDIFTLSGTSAFNPNGFLELSVLDLAGMSLADQEAFAGKIFSTYGSVEKALAASYLTPSQIFFHERETTLGNGAFIRMIDVGSVADGDIVVLSLAASASLPVPEPASWSLALLGFGLTGAAMRRRRTTLSFG